MSDPEDVIADCDYYITELMQYDRLGQENARRVLAALATAGFAVVPQADVDAATRLRELCGFLIDACATHRIPVPLNSSLLDLAADIASDGGAAAAVGSDTPDSDDWHSPDRVTR